MLCVWCVCVCVSHSDVISCFNPPTRTPRARPWQDLTVSALTITPLLASTTMAMSGGVTLTANAALAAGKLCVSVLKYGVRLVLTPFLCPFHS